MHQRDFLKILKGNVHEKNKPSSFPSPSVQEQINPYEEATTKVVSPENLSTKSTPRDKTASF